MARLSPQAKVDIDCRIKGLPNDRLIALHNQYSSDRRVVVSIDPKLAYATKRLAEEMKLRGLL